jgi:hypothetical protein
MLELHSLMMAVELLYGKVNNKMAVDMVYMLKKLIQQEMKLEMK